MRLKDTINPYEPNKAVQTQTEHTSKHTSATGVSGRAEENPFHEYWISLWGWKNSFAVDHSLMTQSPLHESFISGCLLDMGEGMREKGEGETISPVCFDGPLEETGAEHLDHGLSNINLLDRQVIRWPRGGRAGIQSADTLVAFSLIHGNLEKPKLFWVKIQCLVFPPLNVWCWAYFPV